VSPARRFRSAWQQVAGQAASDAVFARLSGRYAAPGRYYHTMAHVLATLDALRGAGAGPEHPAEAELALWYHDAVYDPQRDDNEAASAELAARDLGEAGVSTPVVARISALIMDTRHIAHATSLDGALVADADLAVLGAPADVFDKYDAAIRREYAFVPEPAYRAARAAVLSGFLARPSIYQTDGFRRTHETSARANLARAIARLQPEAD
jgi:predicted metal-dependent HD superfamily phosphohydrolase